MLQTIKGKKRLAQSIPKIKGEYFEGGNTIKRNKMKLFGRKTFLLADPLRESRNRTMTEPIDIGTNQ